jgi:hypothetical protein
VWIFLTRRLRRWLVLAIALPLARATMHRLARAAEHRNPAGRTAKALRHADSAVTALSRRRARGATSR